ncbi:GumC family protein [Shimia sp.]|uniref:GumC family protein n=1 Tax=Shimia sp. TaxID=1954381 RepID=UPI003BA9AF90
MMQSEEQRDQIDLAEFLAAVWHSWRMVSLITIGFVSLAVFYAFVVAEPQYEASTRFELLEKDQGGGGLGQVAGLAAIAGINISASASEAESLQDRVLSRPFVESIYEDASFASDPEFNFILREPSLVDKIKALIRGAPKTTPDQDGYYVMAVKALSKRMTLSPKDNGIVKLTIRHPEADRAAHVANVIVERALNDIFLRERGEVRDSLNYFADELLQVRENLDSANSAMRDFAIENSLLSDEELGKASAQLTQVRRDISLISDSLQALESINDSSFDGTQFVQDFPVAMSLPFRRVLKLSGKPSEWESPTKSEVERASSSLRAQQAALISSLDVLEKQARVSGAEALELAALEREVEVRQAIYESLITQFQSQTLLSGYERASGRIIETAIAPSNPISPKKPLLIVLGLVIGLIMGVIAVLFCVIRREVIYSKGSMIRVFESIRLDSNSAINPTVISVDKIRALAPSRLISAIGDDWKVAAVMPTSSTGVGTTLAAGIAGGCAEAGRKTAILNLSEKDLKQKKSSSVSQQGDYSLAVLEENVDVLRPSSVSGFLVRSDVFKRFGELKDLYERVVVVLPPTEKNPSVSRVVAQLADEVVVVAECVRSTRGAVQVVKSVLQRSEVSVPTVIVV